ncbi:PH domain-containing protein [Candidatus Falkowbacteria bacterium]|jgi:hypothetical protein|nr:PH domain-containing protein [Candidatus Falkowbacteria bacterium]MBT4433558.1 PH domain-containing protein [Candidatus Falkowbacteria bacterium]
MFTLNKIPHQQKDEKVILVLRRHWFILFKYLILFLITTFLPIASYILIKDSGFIISGDFAKALITIILSSYYLSMLLFFFTAFVDYHLDVWIVTNHRILNIEQKALFSRVISELKLEKIQDITSEVHGIIPTFLDYGDVHIQTAGSANRFIFKQIPAPAHARKKILTLLKQSKHFEKVIAGKDKIST